MQACKDWCWNKFCGKQGLLKLFHYFGVTPPYHEELECFERSRVWIFWIAFHFLVLAAYSSVFFIEKNTFGLALAAFSGFLNGFNVIRMTLVLWKINFVDLECLFETFARLGKEQQGEIQGKNWGRIFFFGNVAMLAPTFLSFVNSYGDSLWLFDSFGNGTLMYYTHLQGMFQFYILERIEKTYVEVNSRIEVNVDCDQLERVQKHLACLVCKFNELFGWNMLLHVISYMVSLIEEIYLVLSQQSHFSYDNVYSLLQCIIITIQVSMVSHKAECLLVQNKNLVENISGKLANMKDESLKRQLSALKHDFQSCKPVISAAGFFEVNHGMLFMLFNMIITDLIAVSQFDFTKYRTTANVTLD